MSSGDDGFDELAATAERVLHMAKQGEQLEVAVGKSATTSVRAFRGEVEALTVADVTGIGVRMVVDGRMGFASGGSLEADVIDEVVAEARDNLVFAEPDEHVALVAPDGVMAIATINRTWLSWLFAIVGAEYILRWLPKGTHQWRRFPKPEELEQLLANHEMNVIARTGVRVNPLTRGFNLTSFMAVNYMLMASH